MFINYLLRRIRYGTLLAIDQQNSRSPNMDPFRPNRKKQMPEKTVAKFISINFSTPQTSHNAVALNKKMAQFPRFSKVLEFPRLFFVLPQGHQVVRQVVPDRGFSQETFWPQGSLPRRSSRGRSRKA